MTPKEVLDMAKENGAKMVDLRFMDFPGLWQLVSGHSSLVFGFW
jgi:glutamine synthetase